MRVTALAALAFLAAADASAGEQANAPTPALTRPRMGRLVTVERAWRDSGQPGDLELCLTVENQDHQTAYDAAVWIELLGGPGAEMQRLRLFRTPLAPPTLGPGQSGAACLVAPREIRGIFIRLRARWPAPDGARAEADAAGGASRPGAVRSGAGERSGGAAPRSKAASPRATRAPRVAPSPAASPSPASAQSPAVVSTPAAPSPD
jgi:hypothetical protein